MTTNEILTLLIACLAITISIITYSKSKQDSSYDAFDTIFMDILKIAIDNPNFRNQSLTNNYQVAFEGEEKLKYEIYALICLNFCETIFDKGDKKLNKTWTVIIQTEIQLHRKWFETPDNFGKFKNEFRDFLKKEYLSK